MTADTMLQQESLKGIRAKSGTSFSSPFAAGVAALVWAADPTQSASDVEDVLLANAKASPDASVGRAIDALSAVRSVLGNVPPTIDVVRPSPGDELDLNAARLAEVARTEARARLMRVRDSLAA